MLVVVNGRSLNLEPAGSGSPTVVLDAGLNATADAWSLVQPAVATFTRVCSYDRAGSGRSDRAAAPRTCLDLAEDLHLLLIEAREVGPYVLVGHSFGGLIARIFAHQYPDDVAGMVLIDTPHPDYPRRALEILPPPAPDEHPEIAESRAFFRQVIEGSDDPIAEPAGVGWTTCLAQVRVARSFGNLPLTVISAGKPGEYPPGYPSDVAARVDTLVRATQRDLACLSNRSRHHIADQSGHDVPRDQPDLVVEAIRAMVEDIRSTAMAWADGRHR
jgi:pimeloyl-ACP methyl ester carboxylesterase